MNLFSGNEFYDLAFAITQVSLNRRHAFLCMSISLRMVFHFLSLGVREHSVCKTWLTALTYKQL